AETPPAPVAGHGATPEFKPAATPEERPFPPSYITTDTGRKLEVGDFQDPQICAGCHPRQYKGWKGSMHSNSFRDPVFQALWAIADKDTDGATTNHCGGCHTPIGTATGTVEFNPDEGLHGSFSAPGVAAEGVSCDVCHTISGTNLHKTAVLEHGNASFVLSPGKTKRASLRDAKSPFHETEYSDHHTRSEFCGNCHNIFHPVNNFPIERTYDEWKYSIYAQNDIQCQDCHMVPVDVAIKVADTLTRPKDMKDHGLGGQAAMGGPARDLVHDHGFVGGNALMAKAMADAGHGSEGTYNEAVKRLQNVASLDLKLKRVGDGSLHKLKVKVTNERAGHHLPTSLTEVRQVWIEVVVTDSKGRELMRSGTLDENNEVPHDAVIFNAHAVDENGEDTLFPWKITRFVDVNTIPPKGYKYGKYSFNALPDSGDLTVTAKLHYRSFSQGLANVLLGEGKVTVPSIEMVSIEKSFSPDKLKVAAVEQH
ncbi:MAG: multiheme c-type cytochrome, partial [Pseudomonadota bacterium]